MHDMLPLLRRYYAIAVGIFLLIHFPMRMLAHFTVSRSGMRDWWPHPLFGVVVSNLVLLLSFVLVEGVFIAYVLESEHGAPSLRRAIRRAGSRFGALVVARAAYFAAVAAGLALFIVPGVIVAVLFMLHSWILLAEGVSVVEAYRRSAALVKGRVLSTLRRFLPVAVATALSFGAGFFLVMLTLRAIRPFPVFKIAPLTMTLAETAIVLPILMAGVLFFRYREVQV
jgi:hypothetical protein